MVPGYMVMLLLLQTGMMGTFVALDLFLFYVFWEVMLLPMYFLIGIWGGPRKEYAAIKFFLYTLAGSVLMLLAFIGLYYNSRPAMLVDGTLSIGHTFNLLELARAGQAGRFAKPLPSSGIDFAKVVWVALFVGFAIKIPMFPFHTWLPDAHVEAPTPITVILAGVLLKMGTYGILRFNFAILPDATRGPRTAMAVFGVINIVYGAFVCLGAEGPEEAHRLLVGHAHGLLAARDGGADADGHLRRGAEPVQPRHHQPDALPPRGRDLRPRPPPRDRASSAASPQELPEYTAFDGPRLLRVARPAGPRRVHLRVHGLLGRVPGYTTLTIISRDERHHHGRVLPLGHPADVPRQAEPTYAGCPT